MAPLFEHRVPEPQLEAVLQHRALAAGVDDDLGAHFALGAVLRLRCARRRPASPSKSTSSTRAPSWTSTPCSRALSSIIWSNSLRMTCQVCEHSCGLLSMK